MRMNKEIIIYLLIELWVKDLINYEGPEHCTSTAEVMGLNPVQAMLIYFFRLSFHNCLSCVHNSDGPSYSKSLFSPVIVVPCFIILLLCHFTI